MSSTKTWGASSIKDFTLFSFPAYINAIEAPSEWPNYIGFVIFKFFNIFGR